MQRFERRKRDKHSLTKNFYLTPKDVAYRLAMENAGYDREKIPLQSWYSSLLSTKSSRDRYFLVNSISFILLILANFGAINQIEYSSVKISNLFILPSIFSFYSISLIYYSYFQSKVRRYEEVFNSIYERMTHSEKFDFLLRYPESFNALQFNPFIAGNPKHMFPAREYPLRLILIVVLTLLISVPWLCVTIWIVIKSTIAIQSIVLPSWPWFGPAVNVAAWSALIGSSLLTTSSFKRKYTHFGMVALLTKARKDEKRHKRLITRINSVQYPYLYKKKYKTVKWKSSGISYSIGWR